MWDRQCHDLETQLSLYKIFKQMKLLNIRNIQTSAMNF